MHMHEQVSTLVYTSASSQQNNVLDAVHNYVKHYHYTMQAALQKKVHSPVSLALQTLSFLDPSPHPAQSSL